MGAIEENKIYVRYCETDAGGHVNNVSYFIYFEEARTRFFQMLGVSAQHRPDYSFIIANAECDYVAQAYAGQNLRMSTEITRIGTKSFTMSHEIKEEVSGDLIARGSAVVVCFKFDEQKSIEIPPQLRTKLEGFTKS